MAGAVVWRPSGSASLDRYDDDSALSLGAPPPRGASGGSTGSAGAGASGAAYLGRSFSALPGPTMGGPRPTSAGRRPSAVASSLDSKGSVANVTVCAR